jgi:hypothetical protein
MVLHAFAFDELVGVIMFEGQGVFALRTLVVDL